MIFENHNVNDGFYDLKRNEDGYYLEGKLILTDIGLSFLVSKIEFEDYDFNQTVIKNYKYQIFSGNEVIYIYINQDLSFSSSNIIYGKNGITSLLTSPITINEFSKSFKIDYKIREMNDIDKLVSSDLCLKFVFIDINDNEIPKDIKIDVIKQHKVGK